MADASDPTAPSRHDQLKQAAARYGEASLENYARVRSLAERIKEGFCAYLSPASPPCVFLVPVKGAFQPRDYGSAAFSVSGSGFLPLGPISFALALRASETGDFLRIVLTCMKEGEELVVRIKDGETFEFPIPITDAALADFFEALFRHARDWFEERVRMYEAGAYGGGGIGFELVNVADSGEDALDADAAPVLEPAGAPGASDR